MQKFIKLIFFGNYFIGFIAIALSIESCVQLKLPLNSLVYYIILFCAAVFYYTYAYMGPLNQGENINARKIWYRDNNALVLWSQRLIFITCAILILLFLYQHAAAIISLPIYYWLAILIILLCGLFYYGLLPKSKFKINLRNTGWIKAFVIGFVWACVVNIISIIIEQVENGVHPFEVTFLVWLFIKNWMFCTVNAIIFDIKDYADDSNHQLKTFVVSFGLRRTIFYILLPLIFVGLFSLVAYNIITHHTIITFIFNLIPFILLLMIAWSMHRQHKILYYLIIIDGLIFLKALCGIAGAYFVNS